MHLISMSEIMLTPSICYLCWLCIMRSTLYDLRLQYAALLTFTCLLEPLISVHRKNVLAAYRPIMRAIKIRQIGHSIVASSASQTRQPFLTSTTVDLRPFDGAKWPDPKAMRASGA
jgi:hypothetical protein